MSAEPGSGWRAGQALSLIVGHSRLHERTIYNPARPGKIHQRQQSLDGSPADIVGAATGL